MPHWSSSARKASKVPNASAGSVTSVVKNGSGIPSNIPQSAWSNSIPNNAIRPGAANNFVSFAGDSLEEVQTLVKGGNAKSGLKSINSSLASDASSVKSMNSQAVNFPEPQIRLKNVDTTNSITAASKKGSNVGAAKAAKSADEIASVVQNDGVWKKIVNVFDGTGTIIKTVTITGFVVLGGVYIYSKWDNAIAANSGCFIVEKKASGNVWKRIIGASCGESGKKGDALWLEQNLPYVNAHPLACVTSTACPDSKNICEACTIEQLMTKYPDCDPDDLPTNITLICRESSMFDVAGDVANEIGKDLGSIIGGGISGIWDGLVGKMHIFNTIIALVAGVITFLIVKSVAPDSGIGLLIAIIAAIIVFVLILIIGGGGSGSSKSSFSFSHSTSELPLTYPKLPFDTYGTPTDLPEEEPIPYGPGYLERGLAFDNESVASSFPSFFYPSEINSELSEKEEILSDLKSNIEKESESNMQFESQNEKGKGMRNTVIRNNECNIFLNSQAPVITTPILAPKMNMIQSHIPSLPSTSLEPILIPTQKSPNFLKVLQNTNNNIKQYPSTSVAPVIDESFLQRNTSTIGNPRFETTGGILKKRKLNNNNNSKSFSTNLPTFSSEKRIFSHGKNEHSTINRRFVTNYKAPNSNMISKPKHIEQYSFQSPLQTEYVPHHLPQFSGSNEIGKRVQVKSSTLPQLENGIIQSNNSVISHHQVKSGIITTQLPTESGVLTTQLPETESGFITTQVSDTESGFITTQVSDTESGFITQPIFSESVTPEIESGFLSQSRIKKTSTSLPRYSNFKETLQNFDIEDGINSVVSDPTHDILKSDTLSTYSEPPYNASSYNSKTESAQSLHEPHQIGKGGNRNDGYGSNTSREAYANYSSMEELPSTSASILPNLGQQKRGNSLPSLPQTTEKFIPRSHDATTNETKLASVAEEEVRANLSGEEEEFHF